MSFSYRSSCGGSIAKFLLDPFPWPSVLRACPLYPSSGDFGNVSWPQSRRRPGLLVNHGNWVIVTFLSLDSVFSLLSFFLFDEFSSLICCISLHHYFTFSMCINSSVWQTLIEQKIIKSWWRTEARDLKPCQVKRVACANISWSTCTFHHRFGNL